MELNYFLLFGLLLISTSGMAQTDPCAQYQNNGFMDAERPAGYATIEDIRSRFASGPQSSDIVLDLAHRGYWKGSIPENSLASVTEAINMGVEIVEFDVINSTNSDGSNTLYILHDQVLERLTTGSGMVRDAYAYGIRSDDQLLNTYDINNIKLRLQNMDESEYQGIKTLKEGLCTCKGKVMVSLDNLAATKPYNNNYSEEGGTDADYEYNNVLKTATQLIQELGMEQDVILNMRRMRYAQANTIMTNAGMDLSDFYIMPVVGGNDFGGDATRISAFIDEWADNYNPKVFGTRLTSLNDVMATNNLVQRMKERDASSGERWVMAFAFKTEFGRYLWNNPDLSGYSAPDYAGYEPYKFEYRFEKPPYDRRGNWTFYLDDLGVNAISILATDNCQAVENFLQARGQKLPAN